MERKQRVRHSHHSDDGEESGANLADLVAKVEEPDGQAAKDDGEVEPREEGALVGEENFGFDARGEGDALAWGWRVRRVLGYGRIV
jgi:hypothetical protein